MARRVKEYCPVCGEWYYSDYDESPECPNGCGDLEEGEELPEEDEPDAEDDRDEAAEFGGVDLAAIERKYE